MNLEKILQAINKDECIILIDYDGDSVVVDKEDEVIMIGGEPNISIHTSNADKHYLPTYLFVQALVMPKYHASKYVYAKKQEKFPIIIDEFDSR